MLVAAALLLSAVSGVYFADPDRHAAFPGFLGFSQSRRRRQGHRGHLRGSGHHRRRCATAAWRRPSPRPSFWPRTARSSPISIAATSASTSFPRPSRAPSAGARRPQSRRFSGSSRFTVYRTTAGRIPSISGPRARRRAGRSRHHVRGRRRRGRGEGRSQGDRRFPAGAGALRGDRRADSRRACCSSDLPAPARRCWRGRSPARRACRFSSPAGRTSSRCMPASARRASAGCSGTPAAIRRASSSSTSSTPSAGAAAATRSATKSASRRSTSCSSRWTASRPTAASSSSPRPTVRTSSIRRCCGRAGSIAR